jgi:PKD repeat protein
MAGILLICLCIAVVPVHAAVTLDAAGPYNYYFGQEIIFLGTSDHDQAYLFITGPGLPPEGSRMSLDPVNTPVIDNIPSSFSTAPVLPDQTWEWRWSTVETMPLDPGIYTVYAVDQPRDFFNLSENKATYDALDIELKWPFISGMVLPSSTGPVGTVFTFEGVREGGVSPTEFVYITVTNNSYPDLSGSLPQGGVKPDDLSVPSISGTNATFAQVWVEADGTWTYTWDTAKIGNGALLPGSVYRFYVINTALSITDAVAGYNPPFVHYLKYQIGIEGPVTAAYTVNTSLGSAPLTVEFTDTSTGVPTDVWIDFGDGTNETFTSPGASVTHTYTEIANYKPVIYAQNSVSSDAQTRETITVTSDSAAFTYTVSDLRTVFFYDMSPGTPTTWDWDFGDGYTSTEQNPVHTYATFGTYMVTLTIDGGADFNFKTHWIVLQDWTENVDAAYDAVIAGEYGGILPQGITVFAYPSRLNPGGFIQPWGDRPAIQLPTDAPGTLIFIDENPNANWEHPCTYFYVKEDGSYTAYPASSPPTNMALTLYAGAIPDVEGMTFIPTGPIIDSILATSSSQNQVLAAETTACIPDTSHNYALLISGGVDRAHNPARYYNDIKFMYNTLVSVYKYNKNNIRVLVSDGLDPGYDQITGYSGTTPIYGNSNPDLDGIAGSEINGDARKQTLNDTLRSAPFSTLTSADTLFIFTTNHGGLTTSKADPNTNDVILYLWNGEYMTDKELVAALPKNTNAIIITMEQCYSGGFIDDFITDFATVNGGTVPTRVITTAAKGDEVSHSNDFSYYWISGVAGRDTTNAPTYADLSPFDQRISMGEGYEYARIHDPSAISNLETPQYQVSVTTPQFLSSCAATSPIITVLQPGAGVTWNRGLSYRVKWSQTGLSSSTYVKIELMKGAGMGEKQADISRSVLASAGSTGVSWTVPATLPRGPGTDYWIKISTIGLSPTIFGTSPTFSFAGVGTSPAGTLVIKSLPVPGTAGSSIFVNDIRQAQTTDATFTSMIPISYIVSVSKAGYYQASPVQVALFPGGTTTKTFTLLPVVAGDNTPYGSIAISSVPEEGFEVFIDDVDMGYETPVIQEVEPICHDVRLEMPGYYPQTKTVCVPPHTQVSADFTLAPIPFVLGAITATPSGPVAVSPPTTIAFSAPLTYETTPSAYTAIWEWGDGTQSAGTIAGADGHGRVDGSHRYTEPGLYTVTLRVTDHRGLVRRATYQYVVIYDPDGGFVTGGGWIESPAGTYVQDLSLSGKATFSFVSKYVKGKSLPTGNTVFQFSVGQVKFQSTSYEWLVVADNRAQFTGVGTLNGKGRYQFSLTAVDGDASRSTGSDRFRMKIWNSDQIVYDTQLGAADDAEPTLVISGGSIQIHQSK